MLVASAGRQLLHIINPTAFKLNSSSPYFPKIRSLQNVGFDKILEERGKKANMRTSKGAENTGPSR